MAYQAKWGNKGFLVSPSKIGPLTALSTAFKRKTGDSDDTSGQPTTNTRGIELQEITLETTYLAAAGLDPRAQIEDWKAQFGLRFPLYINGQKFGPDLMELEDVSFSNIVLDNAGRFLRVDATIHLVEYVPPTTTVSEKKQTQAGTSGTNAGALAASPSTTDRENMAPTTHSGGGGSAAAGGGGGRR